MNRHLCRVTFRHFLANPLISSVKLIGLIIGISSSLLLLKYLAVESSYDKLHENAENIHRLIFHDGPENQSINMPEGMFPLLCQQLPAGVMATKIKRHEPHIFVGNRQFGNISAVKTDTNFFHILNFPIAGGAKRPSYIPKISKGKALITVSLGKKLFGDIDPKGKWIRIPGYSDTASYIVSDILEDIPFNSHLQFDLILPDESEGEVGSFSLVEGWGTTGQKIYLKTPNEKKLEELQKSFQAVLKISGGDDYYQLSHQPLLDIHLTSHFPWEFSVNGSIREFYILGIVAILIFALSLINYILLLQAEYAQRYQEMGIRKTLGAEKGDIVRQFQFEALFYVLVSFPFALILAVALSPRFFQMVGTPVEVVFYDDWILIGRLFLITLMATISVSILAARKIINAQVVHIVKEAKIPSSGAILGRKILLSIQFFISLGLICCLAILSKQIRFTQTQDLGFNRENIVILNTWGIGKNKTPLMNSLAQLPFIQGLAQSNWVPGTAPRTLGLRHPTQPEQRIDIQVLGGSNTLFELLGFKVLEGEHFPKTIGPDTQGSFEGVIVNETFVKELNMENPVGKPVKGTSAIKGNVIGVVKDFHIKSLYEPIQPVIFKFKGSGGNLMIAYQPGHEKELVEAIQKLWPQFSSLVEPSFYFLADNLEEAYGKESRLMHIVGTFSGVAIFLALIGAFGLTRFSMEQRKKDISIRKIMGASSLIIIWEQNKKFLKTISVGCILAIPLSIYLMQHWLNGFSYRISLSPWEFIIPLLMVLSLAVITVTSQTLSVAYANPADSLNE